MDKTLEKTSLSFKLGSSNPLKKASALALLILISFCGFSQTVIWDYSANTGYNNAITGIFRDDCSGLHQKKSKSEETTGILTIANTESGGSVATPDNISTDLSSLVWGHDNAALTLTSTFNGATNSRLNRIWKVQEEGTVSNVTLQVLKTDVPAGVNYLLVSSNAAFPFASTTTYALTDAGVNWEVELNIATNNYFTFYKNTTPSITINDITSAENVTPQGFTVTLSNTTIFTVSVNYATANVTATAGSDYTSTSGTLNILPGVSTGTINVPITNDVNDEPDETYNVVLSVPVNATLGAPSTGVGTITDNDSPPNISINDVTVTEGTAAGFLVTLDVASGYTVTVNWTTNNGTAVAPGDYVTNSGTVTFNPGDVSEPVSITTNDDTADEPDQAFTVTLSGEVNASVADGSGTGTITDNDLIPKYTIGDVTVAENIGNATMTITLDHPTEYANSITLMTIDNTAVAPGDYDASSITPNPVVFGPTSTSENVTIAIIDDGCDEATERFILNGSSSINLSALDNNGNCNITDNDNPTAVCKNITVALDGTGNVSIVATDVDNGSNPCGGIATWSIDVSAFDCTDLGGNPVTLTVTDTDSNSDNCVSTVTVEDNIAPVANCQNVTVVLDGAGNGSTTAAAVNNGSTDNCATNLGLDITSFDCTDLGANAVVLTVTDDDSNSDTCPATVTVEDNTAPTANCQDVTVVLDGAGNGSTTAAAVNNGSTDNCATNLGLDITSFDCTDVGANAVVLTVTDDDSNSDTCPATVTVQDNTNPTISCVANQNRNIDGGTCTYTTVGTEFNPTAFADNCPGATISNDFNAGATLAGAVFPLGTTTVVWTVTDGESNTATCNFDVIVADNEDPTISCVANQNRNIDGGTCTYTTVGTEFNPTAFADNCPGATISNDFNAGATLAGAVFPLGTTTVVWTVTDGASNTATCNFDVIVADNEDPTISCVANQNRNIDGGTCTYTTVGIEFNPTAFADNCPGATISNDFNAGATLAGAVFPLGTTTVVWTVTDGASNTATCNFDVIVADNEDPTISCVANQNRNIDGGTCTYTTVGTEFNPTAFADNCPGATISNDFNAGATLAGAVFPLGTTTVVWTVTDGASNTATCNFDVIVADNEDPTISCVANQNRNIDGGTCTYTTVGTEFNPTAFADNCPGATISNDFNAGATLAGAVFPLGTTTVVWTVTDGASNTATCSFDVTIADNEDPTISCVANQNRNIDGGTCTYTTVGIEFNPTAFADNCPGATISNDFNAGATLAGAVFPLGTTTVVWTVTDGSSNTATCNFDVIVADNEDPTISCVANQNRNIDGGTCTYTTVGTEFNPTAFADNCPGATISNDFNAGATLAGAVFPLGTTTVVWTVTDGASNTATCNFDVIVADNEDPTISCVANQNRNIDGGTCTYTTVGTEFNPTAFADNCPGATISNDFNAGATLAGAVFPLGTTTVVWTVTDGASNTATCNFDVIVADNEDPTISCVANQNRNIDGGTCTYTTVGTEFNPTAFADNCPGATISNDFNAGATLAGAVFPLGTTTVVWTVTDGASNTATCNFDVIVADNEDPTISCVANQNRNIDGGTCTYTTVGTEFNPTAFADNCPGATISNDFNASATLAGAVFPLGTTTVVWTVTDGSSNTATCSFDVIVADNEDPTISCVANQNRNIDGGTCTYTTVGTEFNPTAFADNCPGATISNDFNAGATLAGAVFPLGTTTVVWTVTDGASNTATCSFDVIVADNEDPTISCVANQNRNIDGGTCTYTTVGTEFNPTAFADNCPGATISNDFNAGATLAGAVFPLGTTTVVWTVTDGASNTATCNFDVIVADNEDPTISCVANQNRNIDGGTCTYTTVGIEFNPTAFADNCPGATISNDFNAGATLAGAVFPLGTTTVVWTVTDGASNTATCNFDVIVADNEDPTISCVANQNRNIDGGTCTYTTVGTEFNPTAFADNCPGATISNDFNAGATLAGAVFPLGTTTVVWTVTDGASNTATCNFDVIVADNEDPTISCVANQNRNIDGGTCTYTTVGTEFNPTGFADNCPGATISNDFNAGATLAGAVFPLGTTTVVWTVTDGASNTATCNFDVIVADNEDPTISCVANQNRNIDGGTCTYTTVGTEFNPTAFADNCPGATISNDFNAGATLAGAVFPLGTTTVVWTVTDGASNTATCNFDVIVADNEDPTITCPADVSQNIDVGFCGANVTIGSPVTGDNCSVASVLNDFNGTADASDFYPIGTTTVIWTVTDGSGNTATCPQDVVINDVQPSLSIADVTINESGGNATFTVLLSTIYCQDVVVTYGTSDATANTPNDYTAIPGGSTVTILAGNPSTTITVPIINDLLDEPTETYEINITGVTNVSGFDAQAIGTITDNDATPCVSINDITVSEGAGTATFTITLSAASGYDVDVDWATADATALAGLDYTSISGTATITAGNTFTTIGVTINEDLHDELNETFEVNLSNGINTTICDAQGIGTITDNDAAPCLSINDIVHNEADGTVSFTVSLSALSYQAISFDYAYSPITATNSDFNALSNDSPISIPAGSNSATISYDIKDDPFNEINETWQTDLINPINASICDGTGILTIIDNDGPPQISIDDVTVSEGAGTATFTISLSVISGFNISVDWTTGDITALAGSDYTASGGTASILAGSLSTTVVIPITDDAINESTETYDITLSLPVNATIADGIGLGTITDDDGAPVICITPTLNVNESSDATLTISINAVSGLDVSVEYSTTNVTATAGSDYVAEVSTLATILAGSTTVDVTIDISEDLNDEINETFTVSLANPTNGTIGGGCSSTVTIIDNDIPPAICQDITVSLDGTGNVSISESAVDNGSNVNGTVVSYDTDITDFDCTDVGGNAVVLTVTDNNSQTNTCNATVTVQDITNPTISCVANQNRNIDGGTCTYTTVGTEFNPTAFADNCAGATISNDFNAGATLAGAVFPLGTTTVVWTVTDGSSNTATCSFDVTVSDNEDPTISCVANQAKNIDGGTCTYTSVGVEFDPTAFADNCPGATISNDFNAGATLAGAVFPLGTTTVVWTVTDGSSNTATCNFDVIVADNEDPTISCVANQNRNIDGGTCTYTTVGTEFNPTAFADNCAGATISNDFNAGATLAGAVFPLGTTTVVWTVTDGASNTATCNFDVIVADNEDPTISCVANQNRNIDGGTCTYTTVGTEFNPTAFADNCPGATISNDFNAGATLAGAVFPLGTTTVVWTVTDGASNTATCNFDVIVADNENPTISCVSNQNRNIDGGTCTYTTVGTEFNPTAFADNCPGATISNDFNAGATLAGAVFPLGTTTVVWTVTDGASNTATCNFDVIVADNEAPTISCVANVTQDTDAGVCNAVVNGIAPASSGDNCSGSTIAYTITGATTASGANDASGTTFNLGTSTVTYTITDGSSNTAICAFTVTIEDNEDPTITCVANVTQDTDVGVCTALVLGIAPATSGDNCSGSTVAYSITGATTASGANDASGTVFNLGTSTVIYTITDGSTNTDICAFTVTIQDNEDPTISCVANVAQDTDAGVCTAVINGIAPTGSGDNCTGSTIAYAITGATTSSGANDASGITFNLGVSTVTYTITDGSSNTATCNFTVTISDNEDPTISCVANVAQDMDPGVCTAVVNGITPTASGDNCTGSTIAYTITGATTASGANDASGTTFNPGVSTVTYTITDGSSNTATCNFTVTISDNEDPTIACVGDVAQDTDAGVCTAVVNGIAPTASGDNCAGSSISYSITGATSGSGANDASGTTFNLGVSTVTYTITDGSSNTATCNFTVTISDNEDPTISCVGNIAQDTDPGNCTTIINGIAPTSSGDNCTGSVITYDITGATVLSGANDASGTAFNLGVSTVTYTITDGSSNTATCNFTVTISDNEDPALGCVFNLTQDTDPGNCTAVINGIAPTSSGDNCTVSSLTYTITGATVASGVNDASGTAFNIGISTVTYTITDGNLNTDACAFTVTIDDNEDPTITCVANVTQDTDLGNCTAVVNGIAPISGDNCAGSTIAYTITGATIASGANDASGTTFNIGTSTVTYTITDGSSNTATCNFTVTIEDNEDPTITCVADVAQNNDAGDCSAVVNGIAPATTGDNCGIASITYTITGATTASGANDASGTAFTVGTSTVTYTITDASANTATCNFDVVITDNEIPVAICQDITVSLDGMGNAVIAENDVDNGSTDNCGIASFDTDINAFTNADLGPNAVVLTVTDVNGNSNTCNATVTVVDINPPDAICQDITVQLDATGNVSIVALDIDNGSTDNGAIVSYVLDIYDFTCADVGANNITLTVTDDGGNSDSCIGVVTVEDNVNPVAVCQDITIQLDATGNVVILDGDVDNGSSDACGIASLVSSQTAFICAELGANVVTLTVTDNNGNTDNCNSTITVEDNVDPTIVCAPNQTQTADAGVCTAVVTVTGPAPADACSVASTINDFNLTSDASDTYPLGTTTVTWTVTDGSGNTANCTQDITVTDDEDPTITCAANQTQTADAGVCTAAVTVTGPTPADNCSVASTINDFNLTSDASDTYPLGTTTVTWTVTDGSGNTNTCTQDITVTDDEDPTITCVANVTQDTDPGVCTAVVNGIAPATSGDNCTGATIAYTITGVTSSSGANDASGETFNLGTSTVTYTIIDGSTNVDICAFTVTIEDNEVPITICQDITVALDGTGNAVIGESDVDNGSTDNCSIASYDTDITAFTNADLGPNPVVLTVTDGSGNTNTCGATVTVIDTNPPVAICQDITVQLDATGNVSIVALDIDNGSTDNGSIASYVLDDYDFTCADVGPNNVTLTVTDDGGNTDSCIGVVTVEDNVDPIAVCQDLTVQLDATGNVSITENDVDNASSDACGGLVFDTDINDFDCSNVGANAVVLTVTDANSNSSTCNATITVEDNVDPIATCQDITVQLDATGNVSITETDVDNASSDACGIFSYDTDINNFDCTNVGGNAVVLTVTDVNSNFSTCNATVTVQDTVAPIAICQDVTINLDATGNASITTTDIDNGSNDNCGIASLVLDITAFDCTNTGGNIVELTVTDDNGNISTCNATVTVIDIIDPVITCPADIVMNNDIGVCGAVVTYTTPVGTDNCAASVTSLIAGLASGATFPFGTTTVTYEVIDASGNSAQCSFDVTINEVLPTLAIDDVTVDEGDGVAIFTLTLNVPNCNDVTVNYVATDLTANNPLDYTLVAGTATILAGDLTTTITVSIVDDLLNEVDEYYNIDLSGVAEATLLDNQALGTITDNDAEPTICIDDVVVDEADGTATLTLSLTAVSGLDASVDFTTVDVSAIAPNDYDFNSGTATVLAGDLTTTIVFNINEDLLDEATETFDVILSNPVNSIIGVSCDGTVTIGDNDDPPAITFINVFVNEGAGNATVTVALDAESGLDVSFDFVTTQSTATDTDDYTPWPFTTATIPAGSMTYDIIVPIIDDAIDELNENFLIDYSNPVNGTLPDLQSIVTIIDNDVTPTLCAQDITVDEGDGIINVTVILAAPSGLDVTFDYATNNLTAIGGNDFTIVSSSALIPAGDTSVVIPISITDDLLDEFSENFQVVLSNAINGIISCHALVTIDDNDATPTLCLETLTEDEGIGTSFVTLSLSAISGLDVTVDYTTNDIGDAIAELDYTSAAGTVTIPAGQPSIDIPIIILEDLLDEFNEDFEINLSNPINGIIACNSVFTIGDNDATPTICLESVTVDEGIGTVNLELALSAISGLDVTVDYATNDVEALAGFDYPNTFGTVTIPAGQLLIDIPIAITEDLLDEFSETFEVNLSNPINGIIACNSIVTIDDNDATPTVCLETVTVDEGIGTVNLELALSAISGLDVTVDYATNDVEALAGFDYQNTFGTVTIPAGQLSIDIPIDITDDLLDEFAETFEVNLSNPINGIISCNSIVTIDDNDDTPTICLESVNVDEGIGTVDLTLTLSAVSGLDVTVDYATNNVEAIDGLDYANTSGFITIPAGDLTGTISINITDDLLDENVETFEVNLSNPINTIIACNSVVTIDDNDLPPSLCLESATVNEGDGSIDLTLSLSEVSGLNVSVEHATFDITAIDSEDYANTSGITNIPAGDGFAILNFPITDDLLDELVEDFGVDIFNPVNATLDGTCNSVVTIIDNDDPPVVCIDSISVGEAFGPAILFLSLDAISGLDVTVDYTTLDVTAFAGLDYDLTAGTATIDAYTAGISLPINITDDAIDELNETFEVNLSNAFNATIGAGCVGEVTILDNDNPPSICLDSAIVDEGAGTVTMILNLSAVSGLDISIEYTTADSTAIGGLDYQITSGMITIPAGDTTASFTINILEDAIYELPEYFYVNLFNAVNTTIACSAVVTITDNEPLPSVCASTITVDEGIGLAAMTFSMSAVSGLDATFDYVSSDNEALDGFDYTSIGGTMVIPAGLLDTTIYIPILEDLIDEELESFNVILTNPDYVTIACDGLVNISDNDATPEVTFEIASTDIDEDAGTIEVKVLLEAVSGLDVAVPLFWTGEAMSPDDYTGVIDTVWVFAGETEKTISIDIIDDLLCDQGESIVITMDEDQIQNALPGPILVHTINITDNDEMQDTDGDGIFDCEELGDCNDNGVVDWQEAYDPMGDEDGDTVLNIDEDADGDGNPCNDDYDGDGIPNWNDLDSDADGFLDEDEGLNDDNHNGEYDFLDPYNPNDDNDGDGILNGDEDLDGNGNPFDDDSDGDGIPDLNDPDDDGDGILTFMENCTSTENIQDVDTDGDGIPNYLDEDSDGDNIPDAIEGLQDPDGDGLANMCDLDSEGDGVPDILEGYTDVDEDGIMNFLDPEADGDLIPDLEDGITDCDFDGIMNFLDFDPCELEIPNGFSPNGDELYDTWVIQGIIRYEAVNVQIFNRWGDSVFSTGKYDNDWNGDGPNGALPSGTYFYIVDVGDGTKPYVGYVYINRD